jgi:transposase
LEKGRAEILPERSLASRSFQRHLAGRLRYSGSFRSEAGATAFCRIRGYLSTLRKQGVDLLASLEATLRGHPILPSFQAT